MNEQINGSTRIFEIEWEVKVKAEKEKTSKVVDKTEVGSRAIKL